MTDEQIRNDATPDALPRGRTCLTCRHWDVRIRRTNNLADSVARCLLPENRPINLVVSGSSGCDRWFPQDADPTA